MYRLFENTGHEQTVEKQFEHNHPFLRTKDRFSHVSTSIASPFPGIPNRHRSSYCYGKVFLSTPQEIGSQPFFKSVHSTGCYGRPLLAIF